MSEESPLRPEHFAREDSNEDGLFYASPRFVTHIDDDAIATIQRFYGETLPPNGTVLDLMSSWVSHLPNPNSYASVTGLGMNAEELAGNPQLTNWVVQDLNGVPVLPMANETFEGAVVTVSVQYLTRPIEVFAEVGRVLKPGAPFIVSYSNRCFPTKAVAVWRALGDRDHADLVGAYFRLSGQFGPSNAYDLSPNPGRSDPVYCIVARKQ